MKQLFGLDGAKICRRVTVADSEWTTTLANVADDDISPEAAWWQSYLRGQRIDAAPSAGKLSIVDAFCGSGGLGLGVAMAAEATQLKPAFEAAIDTDREATVVHQHNLGTKRTLARSITGLVDYHLQGVGHDARFGYSPEIVFDQLAQIRSLDLFIAGPPCQGHSNLNNHTRRQDPRNELYVTTVALGVALGAKAILIENVPTVQNSYSDVVATACGLLRSAGYGVSVGTLKADDFGAPQRRSRFFILAIRNVDLAEDFLTQASSAFQASAQPISWAIADLMDRGAKGVWDSPPELTSANQERVDYLFDNDLFDLPDAQRPDCHKNGTTYTSVYGRMHWNRPSQTITTGIGTPGQGRYIHPLKRRLITPHEAARIQGFPEWFNFAPDGLPLKRKNIAKWIGDAVHPLLGYVATLLAMEAMALSQRGSQEAA